MFPWVLSPCFILFLQTLEGEKMGVGSSCVLLLRLCASTCSLNRF